MINDEKSFTVYFYDVANFKLFEIDMHHGGALQDDYY